MIEGISISEPLPAPGALVEVAGRLRVEGPEEVWIDADAYVSEIEQRYSYYCKPNQSSCIGRSDPMFEVQRWLETLTCYRDYYFQPAPESPPQV